MAPFDAPGDARHACDHDARLQEKTLANFEASVKTLIFDEPIIPKYSLIAPAVPLHLQPVLLSTRVASCNQPLLVPVTATCNSKSSWLKSAMGDFECLTDAVIDLSDFSRFTCAYCSGPRGPWRTPVKLATRLSTQLGMYLPIVGTSGNQLRKKLALDQKLGVSHAEPASNNFPHWGLPAVMLPMRRQGAEWCTQRFQSLVNVIKAL